MYCQLLAWLGPIINYNCYRPSVQCLLGSLVEASRAAALELLVEAQSRGAAQRILQKSRLQIRRPAADEALVCSRVESVTTSR